MGARKLGDSITCDMVTHDPKTGALANATGMTAAVYEDDNDTALVTPTPTQRGALTGHYRITFTASSGSGFEVGKSYNVVADYTVGASPVAQAQVLYRFTLDGKRVVDLNDITAASVWAVTTRALTTFGTLAADVWAVVTRTLTSNGNDLSKADVQDALTAQGYTTGRAAKLDNADVATSTRGTDAGASAAVTAAHGTGSYVDSGAAPTPTEINTALSTAHGAGSWEGGGSAPSVLDIDAQLSLTHGASNWEGGGAAPTVPQIVSGILNESLAGHATAGSVGAYLIHIPIIESAVQAITPLLTKINKALRPITDAVKRIR